MSRLTGKEVYSLMEAYQQVYAPRELTEEQVWEGVENWVNSLLEEGYDLSDYTWEEMYEGYITEILGMPGAQNAGAKVRELGGAIINKGVSNVDNLAKGASDVAGAYGQGFAGQETTSSNPLAKGYNAASRFMSAPARAVTSFGAGVLGLGSKSDGGKVKSTTVPTPTAATTGMYGRYAPGSSQVRPNPNDFKYKSTSDGKNYKNYNDALAANRSRNATRPTTPAPSSVTPTPAAPAPADRPSAPAPGTRPGAPAPAARPSAPAPGAKPDVTKALPTKPAGSAMDQWAKANPRLAAAQAEKDRIRGTSQSDNPLVKDMKDRMPMTPSVQSPTLAKDLGTGSGNQSLLDNPNASKAATPKKPIVSGFDMFDVVLGHLINEGYADTEEAALTIMSNMSEDWRESIVEEVFDEARRADELGHKRGTPANPNIRNIPHSDPSQRTRLNSKVRGRADEMGRERRNSPKYKQGARPPLSKKEKLFLKFADRSSPTSGNPRNPNVQDTGSQTTWPSERRAQRDPNQNPKHNANRDNDE
jgi:hypothetical protein